MQNIHCLKAFLCIGRKALTHFTALGVILLQAGPISFSLSWRCGKLKLIGQSQVTNQAQHSILSTILNIQTAEIIA